MDPAYGSMPSHASANTEIKQLYINGHFCYVFRFGIVTNGLGIIRHISFYNKNFMTSHPDIVVEKKSDSPDEDKYELKWLGRWKKVMVSVVENVGKILSSRKILFTTISTTNR